MNTELEDLAYEAAVTAFDARGIQSAFQAACRVYLEAGSSPIEAETQARLTCEVIQGDAAYEKFLMTNKMYGVDANLLHHFAEREAFHAAAGLKL